MKDELGKKIRNEFVGLKANTYSFLLDDDIDDKTSKSTKKCVKKNKFEDHKTCLEAPQLDIDVDCLKKIIKNS